MGNRAVIVFLKAPERGRVKTRLARDVNTNFAVDLYRAFVEDILAAVKDKGESYLYFWPPHQKEMLCSWLGNQYDYFPQQGDNLGQKMVNAFKDVFAKDIDKAVLIGTDIPQLDPGIILSGFKLLETKSAVIGPSKDGGYYLIGFNRSHFSKMVFQGIEWSTPEVLDQTLASMQQISIEPGFLPLLNDIDTLTDLENLIKIVKQGGVVGPRTRYLLLSDAS